MDLISIIVPVYGVEAYIVECIESLINQSYKNIEILLIDDQSPDKCPEICEKYAEIDKRIKVIHKENGGAGSARNVGLRNYRGEYVCFVDGDDYVDENYIQVLYDAISKNNADIAVIDYEYLYKNKVEKNDLPIQNEKLSNTEYLKQFLTRWNTGMMTNKLFKRSILKNIFFVEGRRIDDEFFTYQAVMNSKFIVQKQDVLYIYRLVAAFGALQAKKWRNICAFQPLLMSFFELILMQGNCFHKELIFFRSVWIVHMETLTNNVKMVEKLNGIG